MLPTQFDSEALELGVLALDKREQAVFLHGEVGLNGVVPQNLVCRETLAAMMVKVTQRTELGPVPPQNPVERAIDGVLRRHKQHFSRIEVRSR